MMHWKAIFKKINHPVHLALLLLLKAGKQDMIANKTAKEYLSFWPCSKFHIPPSTKVPLQESQIKLKTYIGEALKIIRQALVKETYQD